ncbi:hypothetical protein AAG906_037188 [Vitis piasezkii]
MGWLGFSVSNRTGPNFNPNGIVSKAHLGFARFGKQKLGFDHHEGQVEEEAHEEVEEEAPKDEAEIQVEPSCGFHVLGFWLHF